MFSQVTTFGFHTTLVKSRDFSKLTTEISKAKRQTVLFCNVHMLMLAQEDPLLASAINTADVVFADGVPVAWLQRQLTNEQAQVVRGYEMMLAICECAAKNGETVGFIGSTDLVMSNLISNLEKQFEGLKVNYSFCPPFMKDQVIISSSELVTIKNSDLKWLFVGLGCPKQEKWIAQYKGGLDCSILGVGAAFDWISGTTKKPPYWMEKFALAWLYRLFKNPVKMWRRYVIYNSKFIFKALPILLQRK